MNEKLLFSEEDKISGDLNRWFSEINSQLLDTRLGHHMTCLVGVIDLETDKLHYAVAGHLPLPVMVVGGEARFLQGKGRPLGLFPDQTWQPHEEEFPPGATLLAFSDGILEVMPEQDLLEKESQLLQRLSISCPDMNGIMETLGLSELQEAPDDIAILTIQRNG